MSPSSAAPGADAEPIREVARESPSDSADVDSERNGERRRERIEDDLARGDGGCPSSRRAIAQDPRPRLLLGEAAERKRSDGELDGARDAAVVPAKVVGPEARLPPHALRSDDAIETIAPTVERDARRQIRAVECRKEYGFSDGADRVAK